MCYDDRIQRVAKRRTIEYPLSEDDIAIEGFSALTLAGRFDIVGSEANLDERLFLQILSELSGLTDPFPERIEGGERFDRHMRNFFMERLEARGGVYHALDVLMHVEAVLLVWK